MNPVKEFSKKHENMAETDLCKMLIWEERKNLKAN